MSAKELVLESVRQMSDVVTMDEIVEELAILAGIRRGEQAAEEGRVISHEEIKRRVATGDNYSDLVAADSTSVDFWDNALDDEDWNDA